MFTSLQNSPNMRIDVQAPFSVSEPLQQLIEEKVNKLTIFFDRIQSARVFLKDDVNRFNHKDARKVEIEVNVPGATLYADESAETFEKAVAGAADKLKRQIRELKKQINEIH
jgi:putative sigma-54 modulation protein